MKKNVTKWAFILLVALSAGFVWSCSDDDDDPEPVPQVNIYGTWTKSVQGMQIVVKFNSNGTFDAGTPDTLITGFSNFTATATTFNITDNSPYSACGTTEGKYSYTVSDTNLNIIVVGDSCLTRMATLVGAWVKQ